MIKVHSLLIGLLCAALFSYSQQPATSPETIKTALEKKQSMADGSLVKNVPFENIGPTIMSGRVVDLAVNPDMPSEFYVAYASGGLWHTINNGTTFEPILDNAPTQNIGDIAVHWPSRTIYVGTGENNASRSSYAGIGLLKSTNNGKTWSSIGLLDSHHIGRILIHPDDPDIVVVGVTGHLYSANTERGIYKTTDGGNTWTRKLFVDDVTGIIDLNHSPENFNVMYATAWTKDRKAWNFTGNGEGSGIYKSEDAGENWIKVSTASSGFPTGDGVGRIGVAIYDDNTVYAIHDSQFRRPISNTESIKSDALVKDDFITMDTAGFLALDNKRLDDFLRSNGFQETYSSQNIKQMVKAGSVKPEDLALYLEDANSLLFDTPVVGAEIYKSSDGGKSWKKTHEDYLDGVYYSYGYYFGHIYVSPANVDHIYIYGVPILKSKDGGKSFTSISAENVHSDHHALWINPKKPNHLINGNDGGVNISYDDGANWIKNNAPAVGQFYYINFDYDKPYNVYGGLQDNGVWKGAHNAREDKAWQQNGQYPWQSIMGGDGMQVQIDKRNSNIVYTGFQFGIYSRLDLQNGKRSNIQPKHTLGEAPYRFNWQTPILLSSHNQDILYYGANKLLRSMDRGDHWEPISGDLTNGGKQGNVSYGTLASISESPFQFGLLYTGSDDGLVQRTLNGGGSWENITGNLPKDLWVSRVVASQHKKERVYLSLNGYRWDDFKVYLYKSDNYGDNWISIGEGIPSSPVNVIVEDPVNENLLYVGTDNGVYVSFNAGQSWELFSKGLPNVAVHDLKIQPDENHLLVGTHGRSIYKADISPLQKLVEANMNKDLMLYNIADERYSPRWGQSRSQWSQPYEPQVDLTFYSNSPGKKELVVRTEGGIDLFKQPLELDKGLNYTRFGLELSENTRKALLKENKALTIPKAANGKYYMPKGTYKVVLGGESVPLVIK